MLTDLGGVGSGFGLIDVLQGDVSGRGGFHVWNRSWEREVRVVSGDEAVKSGDEDKEFVGFRCEIGDLGFGEVKQVPHSGRNSVWCDTL